jgi:demethylmenaquinone methyltransferase/2-methoxy-6-polyprenyl-1,4-benzoquinol methylase
MSQVEIPTEKKDRREYVKGLFNSIAGTYDLLNSLLSFRIDSFWRRKTVKMAQVPANGKVLDLCTGTGKLAFTFAKKSKAAQVIGTDFSPVMIIKALECQKKITSPYKQKISFFPGDALKLSFKDNTFDAVSCAFGIRNVVDLETYFNETFRVTKPGGKLLSLELTRGCYFHLRVLYYPYLHFYLPLVGKMISGNSYAYEYLAKTISEFVSPPEILKLMEKAGWKGVKAVPLTGGIATLFIGTK